MTIEQLIVEVRGLRLALDVLRAQFEAHVKADNTMPRHGSAIIEPMRPVVEPQREDDDLVSV
jgi:hypothetical protein